MRKNTLRLFAFALLLFCGPPLFSGELLFTDINTFLQCPIVRLLNDYTVPVQAYLSDFGDTYSQTTTKRALGWFGPVKTVTQESAEIRRKFGEDTEVTRTTELVVRFNEYGEIVDERIYVPFGLDMLRLDRSFIKKPLEEPLDLPDGVHFLLIQRETNLYGQVVVERMIDWNGDLVYEIKNRYSETNAILEKAFYTSAGFVSARTFSYDDIGHRLISIRERDVWGRTTYEILLGYARDDRGEYYLQSEERVNDIGHTEYTRLTDPDGRLLEEAIYDRYGQLYTKKLYQYEADRLVFSEAHTAEGLYNRQKWTYKAGLLVEHISSDALRILERDTFRYNATGELVEQNHYGVSGVFLWKRVYQPHASRPSEITQYTSQGDVFSKQLSLYDVKGRLISVKVYSSYIDKVARVYFLESEETWEYIENATKKYVEKTIRRLVIFDRSGKKLSDLEVERQFDERGNVLEEKTKLSGKEVASFKRKFDEQNRVIEEEVKNTLENYKRQLSFHASGQPKEIIYLEGTKKSKVFVYDEGNNLITEERYDANGSLIYKVEYERFFDAWGNWIKVIRYDWEKEPWEDSLKKTPKFVVYRNFEYYE